MDFVLGFMLSASFLVTMFKWSLVGYRAGAVSQVKWLIAFFAALILYIPFKPAAIYLLDLVMDGIIEYFAASLPGADIGRFPVGLVHSVNDAIDYFASAVTTLTALLLAFMIACIAVRILFMVKDITIPIPKMRKLDRLLGIAVGVFKGLITTAFVLYVMSALSPFGMFNAFAGSVVNIPILGWLYTNNPFSGLAMF